jgi:hypothetical protein
MRPAAQPSAYSAHDLCTAEAAVTGKFVRELATI